MNVHWTLMVVAKCATTRQDPTPVVVNQDTAWITMGMIVKVTHLMATASPWHQLCLKQLH